MTEIFFSLQIEGLQKDIEIINDEKSELFQEVSGLS